MGGAITSERFERIGEEELIRRLLAEILPL